MATPFAHTLRSLEADASTGARALSVIAPALLAAWTTWLFAARVEVIESSAQARVVVDANTRELAAAQAGRVANVRVGIGDRVEAGALLVELDAHETTLAHDRAVTHLASLDAVVAQHERQIAAQRRALEAVERATGAAAQEARARVDAVLAEARLAESELIEAAALERAQVAPAAELRRSRAAVDKQRAATRERRFASDFTRLDAERQLDDRAAAIVALEAALAALEVERSDARGEIESLVAQLEQHRVRAPVGGVIGELADIERGAWIDRGERIGAIVPEGELEIEARFAPHQAVGRIKAGQRARLRLDGFPWAQYGSVAARVEAVGREPREGGIVVELAIVSAPATIVLEHGLPGSVEIEVETTSPARLLLRAAGHRLDADQPPPTTAKLSDAEVQR